MKNEGLIETTEEYSTPDYFSEINEIKCELCKIKDIRETMGDITCNSCGTVLRRDFSNYKKYEPIIYSPVDEKIQLIVDGKKINKEILLYYPENKLTPSERLYSTGYRKIRDIIESVNIDIDKEDLKSISNIYWNIIKFYEINPAVKPSFKPEINKKALIILSILYGIKSRNNPIIYDAIAYVNVPLNIINDLNKILFFIFKDTDIYDRLKNNILTHDGHVNDASLYSTSESVEIMNKLIENKIFPEESRELNNACEIYVMMRENTDIRLNDIKKRMGIKSTYKINKYLGQIVNYFSEL